MCGGLGVCLALESSNTSKSVILQFINSLCCEYCIQIRKAGVPVVGLLPLSFKSICYCLLHENRVGPLKYSFASWHDVSFVSRGCWKDTGAESFVLFCAGSSVFSWQTPALCVTTTSKAGSAKHGFLCHLAPAVCGLSSIRLL